VFIESKFFVDDRGTFCDLKGDFDFDIKRVYVCENFNKDTIRGFHFHQYEAKLFYVPKGTVKFVLWQLTVEEADTLRTQAHYDKHSVFIEKLLKQSPPKFCIVSAKAHNTVFVPPMYANAWKPLEEDTILVGCSNRTLEQSVNDDIRINPNHQQFQKFWEVENR